MSCFFLGNCRWSEFVICKSVPVKDGLATCTWRVPRQMDVTDTLTITARSVPPGQAEATARRTAGPARLPPALRPDASLMIAASSPAEAITPGQCRSFFPRGATVDLILPLSFFPPYPSCRTSK